jgi:hypothetical protein
MKTILLRKKGSPLLVQFTQDKDAHFTNVEEKKAKTGEIKRSHYILTSDTAQWERVFRSRGYITVES